MNRRASRPEGREGSSFSQGVRGEVARAIFGAGTLQTTGRRSSLRCPGCAGAALAALLIGAQERSEGGWLVRLAAASTVRAALLLLKLLHLSYTWERVKSASGSSFLLRVDELPSLPAQVGRCCARLWLAGMFLRCGSVVDPRCAYRLEFTVDGSEGEATERLKQYLGSEGLHVGLARRRDAWVVSLVRGEDVAQTLSLVGATMARLRLEEVLALRETRNDLHRRVNAESANIERSMRAAVLQVAYLQLLQSEGKLEGLDRELYQVAMLRLQHVDYSLREIGALLDPPISRATVGRRLARLEDMARALGEPIIGDE